MLVINYFTFSLFLNRLKRGKELLCVYIEFLSTVHNDISFGNTLISEEKWKDKIYMRDLQTFKLNDLFISYLAMHLFYIYYYMYTLVIPEL